MKNLLSFTTKKASVAICILSSAALKTACCDAEEIKVTEFDNSAIFQCRNIFGREVVVIGSHCAEEQARKTIRAFHPKFVFFGMDNKFMTNVNQLRYERDISLWDGKFHKGIGAGESDLVQHCRESGLVYHAKYGFSGAFRALYDMYLVGRHFGVFHLPDWLNKVNTPSTYNMALFEAIRDESIHGKILSITCGPNLRILNASLLDLLNKTDESTQAVNREWVSQTLTTLNNNNDAQLDNFAKAHRMEKLAIQHFPGVKSVLIDKTAVFIASTVHSVTGQDKRAVVVKQEHFDTVKKHFQSLGYGETEVVQLNSERERKQRKQSLLKLQPTAVTPQLSNRRLTSDVAYLIQDSRF